MEIINLYEIGDLVSWNPSNTTNCKGLVCEDTGNETIEILCVEVNNRHAKTKMFVRRELLSIFNYGKK